MSELAEFLWKLSPRETQLAIAWFIVMMGAVPLFWPRKRRCWWVWLLSVPLLVAVAWMGFIVAWAIWNSGLVKVQVSFPR
jgi:hypothetical protein